MYEDEYAVVVFCCCRCRRRTWPCRLVERLRLLRVRNLLMYDAMRHEPHETT